MDSQKTKKDYGAPGAEIGAEREKQGNGGGEIQLLQILKVQACVPHFAQGPATWPVEKLLYKIHLW